MNPSNQLLTAPASMRPDRRLSDVTIIVRECGERTASACAQQLAAFSPNPVLRTSAAPFSAALRSSLELGFAAARPWTLCIDADVLPMEAGLLQLVREARGMPTTAFERQGMVFDKFFAIHRPAGNHLYRTSLIPQAIGLIPSEGTSLRPESALLHQMSDLGHAWTQSDTFVGAHDFEQYYADVFSKCFLQAHKHPQHATYLARLWSSVAHADPDFRVAQSAFRAGLQYDGPIFVSRPFLLEQCARSFSGLKLPEKRILTTVAAPCALRDALLESLPPSLRSAAETRERKQTTPTGVRHWLRHHAGAIANRTVPKVAIRALRTATKGFRA